MKDNKARLTKYADGLKQRLQAPTPDKHKHRPEAFRQMLEIDLRKTLNKIEKL